MAACSVCLRVLAGSEWVEADVVIRRMRTYELDAVPRLRSALCDRCSESIRVRRQQRVEESFAA